MWILAQCPYLGDDAVDLVERLLLDRGDSLGEIMELIQRADIGLAEATPGLPPSQHIDSLDEPTELTVVAGKLQSGSPERVALTTLT